jgi:hypothetical protein
MKNLPGWRMVLLLACFSAVVCAQAPVDEVVRLKQENAELRAELERVKSAYDSLEAETARLRVEFTKMQRNNEDLVVQTRELTELAGLTPSGDRVESAASRFTTEYDNETGKTTVRSGIEELKVLVGSAADHRLSLAYSFDGKQMQSPPQTLSLFIQAFYSGGVYRDQDTALFDIDGKIVEVPIADYDAAARRVSVAAKRTIRKDDETLTIRIDHELLRKLARAIQLKITIGTVQLEPTRDQTAIFRAIQRRIELGA